MDNFTTPAGFRIRDNIPLMIPAIGVLFSPIGMLIGSRVPEELEGAKSSARRTWGDINNLVNTFRRRPVNNILRAS